ncbi:heme ABC transporter ATP-binding protein/permease CydC [Desulfurispira natronophila]|uniref:ATP-binding cassette subfamily C protein CydC n=1 Tax=Desulfurispira natronophila TaxID=682562 RepID=A0A7W7Y3V7_9BACT|nr:cysteine/glutathione ABC transporter ATP-binding protein/permease CydC [Desulfurispira natronophila]MBB5021544.1 ATP-binding cassette subfamily C protein CydC [Desulfurispira natronophila]
MRDLWPFVRLFWPQRIWIAGGLLCGLATMVASVGLLALSGWFLSAAAFAGLSALSAKEFNFFTPSAGVRGFAIMRTGGRYAERILSHEATLRLLAALRVWFYRALEPLAPATLQRYRSGDLLTRIVNDIDTLDNLYIRVLLPSVVALGVATLAGAFLWWLHPSLALVFWLFVLLAGLALPTFSSHLGYRVGKVMQLHSARLRTHIVEDVQGLADLKVYGAEANHRQRVLRESEALLKQQERMARISGFNNAMLTLLSGLAALVALFIAIPMTQAGHFDGAMLALIAFGILAAFESVMPLPLAWQYLGRTMESARRLLEVIRQRPAVTFNDQLDNMTPSEPSISFQQVSFTYPAGTVALQDVDLHIAAGEKVAIVGPSGSGKTTIAHLLSRFWDPRRGTITIGGCDLRHLSEVQLRDTVTLVSQKSHIFCATLRDNLLLANPQADEATLWQTLERAQLHDFVKALPEGLDTWTGEGGSRLSGGQARRLILARALLKNSPIWILDEPTEGLDTTTEQQFLHTLFANMGGKTLVLITHRTSELARMDRVCFMVDSRVEAVGSHAELIQQCERYRRFVGMSS